MQSSGGQASSLVSFGPFPGGAANVVTAVSSMPIVDLQAGPAESWQRHHRPQPSRLDGLREELRMLDAESEPLNLTLGIEIECVLAVNHYPNREGRGFSDRTSKGLDMIRAALREPLTARCASCGHKHEFLLPLKDPQVIRPATRSDYSTWDVTTDVSLGIDAQARLTLDHAENFFTFHGIEIKSRILRFNKPLVTRPSADGHIHTISYQSEISAVLNQLHFVFNSHNGRATNTPTPHRLFVNRSCGLHVHIGNRDRGFPLRTAKNVVSTYVANERQIDALHSTNRIGGVKDALQPQYPYHANSEEIDLDKRCYNLPWSAHHYSRVFTTRSDAAHRSPMSRTRYRDFNGAMYPANFYHLPGNAQAMDEYSIAANLTVIQNAPTLMALYQLHGHRSHNSTVNLENLDDFHEPMRMYARNTIEFRQHDSTLQSAAVLSWVEFVVRLVLSAHAMGDVQFAKLCTGEWQSYSHTTLNLLNTLGCSQSTIRHYEHYLGLSSPGRSYAEDLARDESRQLTETLLANDHILPLLQYCNKQTCTSCLPQEVQACIDNKLCEGGYGQFPDSFLDQLTSKQFRTVKHKLRIGWLHPDSHPASQYLDHISDTSSSPGEPVFAPGALRVHEVHDDVDSLDGDYDCQDEEDTQWFPDSGANMVGHETLGGIMFQFEPLGPWRPTAQMPAPGAAETAAALRLGQRQHFRMSKAPAQRQWKNRNPLGLRVSVGACHDVRTSLVATQVRPALASARTRPEVAGYQTLDSPNSADVGVDDVEEGRAALFDAFKRAFAPQPATSGEASDDIHTQESDTDGGVRIDSYLECSDDDLSGEGCVPKESFTKPKRPVSRKSRL